MYAFFFFFFLFVEQKDIVDYVNENLLCQPRLQKNKTHGGTSFIHTTKSKISFIHTTKSKICRAMYAFFWYMYLYILSYFLVHAWLKDHTFIYKCLFMCYNFILWSSFSWIYYNHERSQFSRGSCFRKKKNIYIYIYPHKKKWFDWIFLIQQKKKKLRSIKVIVLHGTHVCPKVLQQSHQNLGVIFRYSRNMKIDVHFSHIHNRVYSLNL